MKRFLIITGLLLTMANSFEYQRFNGWDEGYKDKKIRKIDNCYEVKYNYTKGMPADTVIQFLLRRCAEIAYEQSAPYFYVLTDNNIQDKTTFSSPTMTPDGKVTHINNPHDLTQNRKIQKDKRYFTHKYEIVLIKDSLSYADDYSVYNPREILEKGSAEVQVQVEEAEVIEFVDTKKRKNIFGF